MPHVNRLSERFLQSVPGNDFEQHKTAQTAEVECLQVYNLTETNTFCTVTYSTCHHRSCHLSHRLLLHYIIPLTTMTSSSPFKRIFTLCHWHSGVRENHQHTRKQANHAKVRLHTVSFCVLGQPGGTALFKVSQEWAGLVYQLDHEDLSTSLNKT